MVSEGDLIEPPPSPPEEEFEDNEDVDYDALDGDEAVEARLTPTPSSKIQHLISLLQLIPSTEKSLVFSQFTSFLDQIAIQLKLAGWVKRSCDPALRPDPVPPRIPYVRFDGSMPQKQRAEVLKKFAVPLKDPNETESEDEFPVQTRRAKGKAKANPIQPSALQVPVVMLISLKAGALGLNLTAASRVLVSLSFKYFHSRGELIAGSDLIWQMDPWWQVRGTEFSVSRLTSVS